MPHMIKTALSGQIPYIPDNDQWEYMRYLESINANGDYRVAILSFSEWQNDGKPSAVAQSTTTQS